MYLNARITTHFSFLGSSDTDKTYLLHIWIYISVEIFFIDIYTEPKRTDVLHKEKQENRLTALCTFFLNSEESESWLSCMGNAY